MAWYTPTSTAWLFTLPSGTESVGVRFRPGAATHLLRTSASDIRNVRVGLADVLGSTCDRVLTDRIENAPNPSARIIAFEDAVRRWQAHHGAPDRLVENVRGALGVHSWSVAALADAASITERQLQCRCKEVFGYSPATLRGILRLQRFMAAARTGTGGGLADLAIRAGYSDQAHLSRECRRISTLTPTALLASQAPDWHGEAAIVDLGIDVGNIQSRGRTTGEESAA